MSCVNELSRSRFWPRAAALTLLTIGVAACSGEATRLNDSPYRGNPEATGSIPQGQAAPAGRVESRPLPPQAAQAYPPPPAVSGSGTAGGGRGMASYTPGGSPPRTTPPATTEVTGSVAPAQRPIPTISGHWTWDGGTPITVAQGDTVDSVARRYGVPTSAIIQANNLTLPATIHAGQQLVIPRYSAAPVASPAPPRPAMIAPAHKAAAPAIHVGNPGVHVVTAGETLSKISRLYGKPVGEIAKANRLTLDAKLSVGDRLVIPGVRTSQAKPLGPQPKAAPALVAAKPAPLVTPQLETETAASASVFTPVAEPSKDSTKSADATGALPKFRWPANGRVIAGHGPLPNGQQNDGINIALPENTPVKAAEDGAVAYAGNELKGYGNLILVRHPNGYVTAYAHLKELTVKRGDQVKRGQMIARSGQTGNVNTPQLHFEVRKGATPVDPIKFLNGM
jgi:murein DD-endopeptidase MepM/ murein hydrolase activator NlpD